MSEVQIKLKAAQGQVQQMQQQMQAMQLAMKQRSDIEGVKQQAETQRELMRQTAKAHNTELMAQARVHDVNTKAITSQNKTEIEMIADMILHNMDTARLEKEIAMRNREQYQAIAQADQSIMPNQGY